MRPNLPKILTFLLVFYSLPGHSQEIWSEHFSLPEKGIWGSDDGSTVLSDFEGITSWTLEYPNVSLSNADDYAKTVSTSGGRFECRDINGEVVWYSEEIDISEYTNVNIQLIASETGSGKNEETKYLKAFYQIDDGPVFLFESKGENYGNWGLDTARQTNLNGERLQIVVQMNNHYASDKVILDEVVVSGEEKDPVFIEPGDILISEVLFNPVPEGEDYVEIYNYSEKQIPLNKLYLASRDTKLELTQIYSLTTEKLYFEPGSYLALTKDTNGVFPWFSIECTDCFLQMEKFPSFNNDEDYVVLLNNELEVIDELHYTEDLHLPVFHDREGISLERISFTSATNQPDNWHSASSLSGYGTPGYTNSQTENDLAEKATVSFDPESFSPNSDGYNDEYFIHFQLDKPGYLCNVWVFDAAGRQITQLAQNNVLGISERLSWNGTNENGQVQKLGVYVVLVELYDLNGNITRYKDGVVLTNVLK
ncbi:lamin tail domain-containing protein [Maribellus sp. YY47]|uniref:lamin tail domain-containing protein n=1 Tax=Maribellus sp. YY47 TaxID=2929486 RepID=UPI0020008B59|nr:lamin tail domain-containing protein [Maribellus sp. YY47]MCK3682754.1 lamin tail domain-containing protein [Maribellus sp. YY47]